MLFLVGKLFTLSLLATTLPAIQALAPRQLTKLRTVFTTDMEQDDLASLIRFLLYANELDIEGIIYTSSRYHWAGNFNGTEPSPPEATDPPTSYRWTGTRTIQDKVLVAYADVYQNLRIHDPAYPTPDEVLSKVKTGNIAFLDEMEQDTDGSNLIRSLLMNDDPRPLYLQTWGGTSTIARALKSIETQYSGSPNWAWTKETISRKAVILASGFQDSTYANYISKTWPQVRVEQLSAGYTTWGYNCNNAQGRGNIRGLPDYHEYFTGAWIKANIETGPYGKLYRSWLDGQRMPGDPLDVFGDFERAKNFTACLPLGPYDFLSEGDNVAYNPLLTTGIQDPENPGLGGWGGRATQQTTSPNLWVMVNSEKNKTSGAQINDYTTLRWAKDVQNDFAARMQWTLTQKYSAGNHAPSVKILNGHTVKARPGSTIKLVSAVSDPDGNMVATSWWQYFEEGTYPGTVTVTESGKNRAAVDVPTDAKPGDTISIILQGTDDGHFPLSRYDRVLIHVI